MKAAFLIADTPARFTDEVRKAVKKTVFDLACSGG
jgi:hypothetical protein